MNAQETNTRSQELEERGESSQSEARRQQSFANPGQSSETFPSLTDNNAALLATAESLVTEFQEHFDDITDRVGTEIADILTLQTASKEIMVQRAARFLKAQQEVAEELKTRALGPLQQLLAAQRQIRDTPIVSDPVICRECSAALGLGSRFYSCQVCTDHGHVMCLSCFFTGKRHQHDNFICQELYPMGVRETPVYSHHTWNDTNGRPTQSPGQQQRQSVQPMENDLPISQVIRKYLDSIDLQSHRYIETIQLIRACPDDLVQDKDVFRTLKNWAITCILIADFDFPRRHESRGQASLMAVLSPAQRVSVQLLKEWWFSEIQDPTFMIKTFVHSLSVCLFPDTDYTRPIIDYERNRYLEYYHGDLYKLFLAEFEVHQSGDSLSTPQQLELYRQAAINSSCCQRMGQRAWEEERLRDSGFIPSVDTASSRASTAEAITTFCDQWRQDVSKAFGKVLLHFKMTDHPRYREEGFWFLREVVIEGPILLHQESLLHPDVVMNANRLSVHLQPLPWLAESTRSNDRPHYLWDRRLSKTIETSMLADPLNYVAISHTWGRWKKKGVAKIPGVHWEVPMNEIWDVNLLPDYLSRAPGHQRHIWFDLVCIPQDFDDDHPMKAIQKTEISKQAAIFGKAAHVMAWMSTMTQDGLEALHGEVSFLAEGLGTFYKPLHKSASESAQELAKADNPLPQWDSVIEELQKLRGASGQRLDPGDYMPLFEDKKTRGVTGGAEDTQEYVNKWFTSLWTLQEACMRPDMWICDFTWTPLRFGPVTSRHDQHNVSLDAIFSLLESRMSDAVMMREALDIGLKLEPGMDDDDLARILAGFTHLNERVRSRISDKADQEELWPTMKEELEAMGLFSGQLPSWSLGNFSTIHTREGAEAASRGRGPKIYSIFDIIQQIPAQTHVFCNMLKTTGMTRFAELRSRMDIIAIGERRTCKRPQQRAEAIMSAVGVVDWFDPERSPGDPPLPLVLGIYPLPFVDELRLKAGAADFFRSRTLNRNVLKYFEGGDNTPIGSMLPFSGSLARDIMLIPSALLKHSLPVQDHDSLTACGGWSFQLDGTVKMPMAAVVANTRKPQILGGFTNCKMNGYTIAIDGAKKGEAVLFSGMLNEWLEKEKRMAGTSFLVVLSRQQTLTEKISHTCKSHAVLLREVQTRTLVKVGVFTLEGREAACWPPKTTRNWTVL